VSADDLFSASADEAAARLAPLASRMRPRNFDDLVGHGRHFAPGRPLRAMIEQDRLGSVVLWGPPGTGKTTVAELVASVTARRFVRLSAVSAGVADVRSAIDEARQSRRAQGVRTILFVDEIHRFSSAQQDALLPAVESGIIALVGATTTNPHWGLTPALRSRVTLVELTPLDAADIETLLARASGHLGVEFSAEALRACSASASGDARRALTTAEAAASAALAAGRTSVSAEDVEVAAAGAHRVLDDSEHFAVTSALIKSLRARHVDAALHWMMRLLESGEPPGYVGRRLVIFAAEDVGDADPGAIVIARSCAEAAESLGMPEAALVLGHACVHLGKAPRSRSVAEAVWAAGRDVTEGRTGPVPRELAPGGSGLPAEASHWPVGFDPVRYYREGR